MRKATQEQFTARSRVILVVAISLGAVGLGLTRAATIRAQTQASGGAAFEAASVKANKSGSPQGDSRVSPSGRFTSTNLSFQVLIRFAYERSLRSRGLEPFEVTGGPAWMVSDRFDVNATAGRPVSLTELRSMLQTLLIERFKLKAHYETRQGPVYRMVVAQREKLGPQLRRSESDCAAVIADPLRGITPGQLEPCGYFGPSPTIPLGSDKAYQAFRGLTMEDLALRLYPVLESTGDRFNWPCRAFRRRI